MNELLNLPALELAQKIRSREITSVELTKLFLDRIQTHNGELNAFTQVFPRRALASARAKDKLLRDHANGSLPLFHGVPTGIKDLVPMRGSMTRLGTRAFKYFLSPIDAPTSKLLKAGGFVVLGKLATSEFGALPVTEPDIHPPTRNPHDPAHTPGGSSGGSGAAVAAGLLPIAQGSDGGGSIRIPSAFCHLYGFKPSRGLLGNLHGATNILGHSVMGPLSHTVADSMAMLDVLRGRPLGALTPGGETCMQAIDRAPKKLTIRYCTEGPICATHPEIVKAVERTAETLRGLGHIVEERKSVDGSAEEFLPIWQRQIAIVPAISEQLLQPIRGLDQADQVVVVERHDLDLQPADGSAVAAYLGCELRQVDADRRAFVERRPQRFVA